MNIEQKIQQYKHFWAGTKRKRPFISFDLGGFFQLRRFSVLQNFPINSEIRPPDIKPQEFIEDYKKIYQKASSLEDDTIKGLSPVQALPWIESMLGSTPVMGDTGIWAKEVKAGWEELHTISLYKDNPWLKKYSDFVITLEQISGGTFPIGLPILRGVTDLLGVLRGHSESVMDCMDHPGLVDALATKCAKAIKKVMDAHFDTARTFHEGHTVEQYALWAPGTLGRLQEDASALYSPGLFRDFILEKDRYIAASFDYSVIHLHSSSLFLLDEFLKIPEITCFQINKDVSGMSMEDMIPYLQSVQKENRKLYIRGVLTEGDLRIISKSLEPSGLFLQTVIEGKNGAKDFWEYIERYW